MEKPQAHRVPAGSRQHIQLLMLEVGGRKGGSPREDAETPWLMSQDCALTLSGFRIHDTCSGTRKYQSAPAHSLGWRGAGGVSFMFLPPLLPESPEQTDPEAEREWGLRESGVLQEEGPA